MARDPRSTSSLYFSFPSFLLSFALFLGFPVFCLLPPSVRPLVRSFWSSSLPRLLFFWLPLVSSLFFSRAASTLSSIGKFRVSFAHPRPLNVHFIRHTMPQGEIHVASRSMISTLKRSGCVCVTLRAAGLKRDLFFFFLSSFYLRTALPLFAACRFASVQSYRDQRDVVT